MDIRKDNDLYEEMHEKVMRELLLEIYSKLKGSGFVSDDDLESLTEEIGFGVGAIIDASLVMEVDGRDVLPYLAFSESREDRESLIISDTGSYFHEMVYGITDDIDFEQ